MDLSLENTTLNKKIYDFSIDSLKDFLPFFASVSGDNDLGIKAPNNLVVFGSYLFNKDKIFGFWDYKSHHISQNSHKIDDITLNIDFYELNKFIHLVLPGDNGKIFEHIFSDNFIFKSDSFDEFKATVKKYYITKKLSGYYYNNAQNNFNIYKETNSNKLISLLSILRDLLIGINIIKTSEVITNIADLNEQTYKFSYINDLIDLINNQKTDLETDYQYNFYNDEIIKLLELFETAQSKSNLFETVRNKHKLYHYLATVYSQDIFEKEFNIPVMTIIEDPEFIKQEQQKLLLVSSPFQNIEETLDIKLSPQKNVYVPDLDRYFLVKNLKIQGAFFEFIDIETFMQQLIVSNPFSLLALFNTHFKTFSEDILDLQQNSHKLITKQLYNTFKITSKNLYDKFISSDELKYKPQIVIEMLAILIQGKNALKYKAFNFDFEPYMSMFESILHKDLSNKQIINTYEEIYADFSNANKSSTLTLDCPDDEFLKHILLQIKKKHWLNK